MVNQCEQVGRRIVFVYAVRDDIFDEVSRTKFFEFVVPIIPVINASNSRVILLNKIKGSSFSGLISEKLVSDLTLYIDDMRLLLNIFNEFIVYSAKLMDQIILDPEKLLAFIVYKNKVPNDFSLLNKGKGIIAAVFDNKNNIIIEITKQIDEEIESIEQHISDIKGEVLTGSKELRTLYLYKYIEECPGLVNIEINNSKFALESFLDEELFNSLAKTTGTIVGITSQNSRRRLQTFDVIQASIDTKHSYEKRLNLINSREEIKKFHNKIDELKQKKIALKGQSLLNVLESHPDKKVDILGDIVDEKLLSYLLVQGLIDEGYYYYLSYFHPGSRTPQDVNFLLAVNERKRLDVSHKINAPSEVLKQLSERDLGSKYALNLDLLDYMYSVSDGRLSGFFTNFDKFSEDEFEFTFAFISYSSFSTLFVKDLADKWSTFITEVFDNEFVSDRQKSLLIKLLFQNASLKSIVQQDFEQTISDYLAKTEDVYLVLSTTDAEKNKSILKKLKIKITDISTLIELPELFKFIVENENYSLTPTNIKRIFEFFKLEYQSDIPTLIEIKNVNTPDVFSYVDNNLNSYVPNVLIALSQTHSEPTESIIYLLNSSKISIKNKEKVIRYLGFSLSNITDIKSDIDIVWSLLLSFQKLDVSWSNVIEASFDRESESIIEHLGNYLSNDEVSEALGKVSIPDLYLPDVPGFFDKLIVAKHVSSGALRNIVNQFSIKIDSLSAYDLEPEVLSILVSAKKVILSNDNIEVLRTKSAGDVITLIKNNIEKYVSEDGYLFELDANELCGLLNAKSISDDDKHGVISKYHYNLKYDSKTLTSIWNVIKKVQRSVFLNDQLVIDLCRERSLPEKAQLLSLQVQCQDRDWTSVSNLFKQTGIEEFQQISSRKGVIYLSNSKGEFKLTDNLYAKGYISSYSFEGEGDETLKINSKRK